MNSKMKQFWTMLLLASILLAGLVVVNGCKRSESVALAEADVVKATVEGTNFCLGCALKKQKGAAAQCSIFGHKHALEVTRAVADDGKDLTGMRGWILHYLETEKSQHLINEHHGETLTITGKIYTQERVLEVDSLKEAVTPK